MIVGEVKPSREPLIRIAVRGPTESLSIELDAVVDTGFTDFLTLPRDVVAQLRLAYIESSDFSLADGGSEEFDLYAGWAEWDGQWREIVIAAADGGPLVGMMLMQGYHLAIDVVDGGQVVIDKLKT